MPICQILLVIGALLGVPANASQPQGEKDAQAAASAKVLPQVLLGRRVEGVRQRVGVIPVVVIVPDATSYCEAIGAWSMSKPLPGTDPAKRLLGSHFPVLIDDGTWQAREDIARFVRAFGPSSVVRWEPSVKQALPVRESADAAIASAWGGAAGKVEERWKELKFTPFGVVVASPADPAWTAALALGAARGQPIAWLTPPGGRGVDERFSLEHCDQLGDMIEAECTKAGQSWDALGDEIDSVTLCLNTPAAVQLPRSDQREMLATTDLIGRKRNAQRERWAWCGQIFGTESRAAYGAMCALFLQPRSAWLFNGYEDKQPYSTFDVTKAAEYLTKVGFQCAVNDIGTQGADAWRRRAAGAPEALTDVKGTPPAGVSAGLIAVNTSGLPGWFDVQPGQLRSADVPILRVPAMVHFVHSWSANQVGVRETIAGRFIANGAYAYLGSVNEPNLAGFVPTPLMVQRLLAGAPYGVAARLDGSEPWKIAYVGDPLIMIGPAASRVELALPLTGAKNVLDSMTDAVKKKEYERAIVELALLGRDGDAAAIARAALAEGDNALTPGAAMVGVMSMFRSAWPLKGGDASDPARYVVIARLVKRCGDKVTGAPEIKDALWHSVYPMSAALPDETIEVLKENLRSDQVAADAIELAGVIRKKSGGAAANAYLAQVRSKVTYEPWVKMLEEAVGR